MLVGRATRASAWAEAEQKEYVAAFRPGVVTDTQDITGNVLRTCGVLPSEEDVRAMLPRFTGAIEQIPPMYSAIKVRGQKLYEIARRGGEVERAPRSVTIWSLEHLGMREGDHILRVTCSKGTYIRTLCHDLGRALGCGGTMAALRRTRSGAFRVEDARKIAQIDRESSSLLPIDVLFPDAQALTLTTAQERLCRCGNPFSAEICDGAVRLYAADGSFLALGEASQGVVRTVKSFFEIS